MIPVWCGTEEGIKEVLDYFPQGLYSAVNGSLYEGLNVGLNFATGSFVTFLLPNGIFHPLRLAKCVERLQTERGEFLFTHVCGVDHKDQLLPTDHSFWQWRQDLEFQSDLSPTIGFKMLKEMAPVSIANIIVSKRVANRVERIKTSRYGAYDFALKALFYAEPIFFKEELFDFRLSQSENNSEPDPFSYHHHPEAIAIRNDYLLQITTPPENQLAPCPAYWPMVFSSFHLACELDHGMGAKLGDVNVNPHMSKKEEIVRTLNRASLGKVTLLIHDLSLSGAPRVAADLALALKRKGYAPQVISYADGPLRPIFDQHSIPVSFVSSRIRFWYFQKKFKKVALMLSMAWKMFWKAKGTTIAIASLTWPSLFIASFCMPFRKFVWYLHDSYAPEALVLEGVPFRLFQSCIQRKNLSFWFGSDATRLIWEKAEVKGEVVYWSGIDRSQKEVQYKKSLKNILSVGAGYPRKGAHFLLDAFLTCIDKQWLSDEVCLTIVGFPETSKELTEFGSDIIRKVYASRYTHRIKLVKSIEEAKLDHLYRESDLYIQPSFLECLPLAMLKAMSLGIPVITSYVDGCNEAIIDGINGYTCPPRNSLILAEKIAYAINHPEEAQKMGVEGKKVFDEKFSLEATTPHFFSVLEKGVNEKAYTNTYSHDLNKKTAPLTELV
ncbi:MAG: glycosyltransferase family 4 protein [Parachlamydiaceae bacterium]